MKLFLTKLMLAMILMNMIVVQVQASRSLYKDPQVKDEKVKRYYCVYYSLEAKDNKKTITAEIITDLTFAKLRSVKINISACSPRKIVVVHK